MVHYEYHKISFKVPRGNNKMTNDNDCVRGAGLTPERPETEDQWKHTSDLSDEFFRELVRIGDRLGTDPLWILQVCMAESGVRSGARNPVSSATGLIQFMHNSWRDAWGFERDAFAALSAEEQLPYLEEYFRPWKGRLTNVTAVYCAVFMPVMLPYAASPNEDVSAPSGAGAWACNAKRGMDR